MGILLRFLRRGNGKLAIVERLALTPHHTLSLVRVGEETLLIGTGPSTFEVLRGAQECARAKAIPA